MQAKLSIAMIVKNEAQHLPECLECIAPIADEVCVLDTGSTDDTVAIAARHGARVSHFAWCDDFAAARNASLSRCTGDWIFVIDADERVASGDHAGLRTLLEGPRDTAYRFVTRNYTDNAGQSGFVAAAGGDMLARGFSGWFPSAKVRLFPNGLQATFEGAVHELINPSLERAGIRIVTSDIPVHHYALTKTPEAIRHKQELYLRLGEAKLARDPEDPKAHAELGNQYSDLGDYGRAAQCYREALKRAPRNAELLKDLGGVLHLMGRSAEAEKALRLAVGLDAGHVEAWRNLGVVLAAGGDWRGAGESFARAAALAPERADLKQYLAIARQKG